MGTAPDLGGLSLERFCNVVYCLIVDEYSGAMASRDEVRKQLDRDLQGVSDDPGRADPDSWGATPEAQAEMNKAMSLLGA